MRETISILMKGSWGIEALALNDAEKGQTPMSPQTSSINPSQTRLDSGVSKLIGNARAEANLKTPVNPMHSQPSLHNPTHFTLHTSHYTLRPETRTPTPDSRISKPESRSLKPETPNSKPEALHPRPKTRNAAPGDRRGAVGPGRGPSGNKLSLLRYYSQA